MYLNDFICILIDKLNNIVSEKVINGSSCRNLEFYYRKIKKCKFFRLESVNSIINDKKLTNLKMM